MKDWKPQRSDIPGPAACAGASGRFVFSCGHTRRRVAGTNPMVAPLLPGPVMEVPSTPSISKSSGAHSMSLLLSCWFLSMPLDYCPKHQEKECKTHFK